MKVAWRCLNLGEGCVSLAEVARLGMVERATGKMAKRVDVGHHFCTRRRVHPTVAANMALPTPYTWT